MVVKVIDKTANSSASEEATEDSEEKNARMVVEFAWLQA